MTENEHLEGIDPDPELGNACDLEPSEEEEELGMLVWREIDDDDDESNGLDDGEEE